MQQQGRKLVGDINKVDRYTKEWPQVRLHPIVFYRRYDSFIDGLKSTKGMYAALDLGQFISIRFSDKSDVTEFHRLHHAYV